MFTEQTCLAHMAGATYLWYDTVCCSLPRKIHALFWGLLLLPAEFNTAGVGLLPAPKGLSPIDKKSFSHLDMHRPYGIGMNYPELHIKDFFPYQRSMQEYWAFPGNRLVAGKILLASAFLQKGSWFENEPQKIEEEKLFY